MAKDVSICLCKNCNIVLIDETPHNNQPKVDLKDYPDAKKMSWGQDIGGYYYYACPKCLRDNFLRDK